MSLTKDDLTAIGDIIKHAVEPLERAVENLPTHADLEAVAAKIERVETARLTAFHQWASPVEAKLRSHREAIRALDQEHENSLDTARKIVELEHRISKLEKAS